MTTNTSFKSKKVTSIVESINRRKLTNNTQRVLHSLLKAKGGWVSRTAFRVPSAGSRLRDLRKPQYGGFTVECASANDLNKRASKNNARVTYYRINPKTVTASALEQIFKGVVR